MKPILDEFPFFLRQRVFTLGRHPLVQDCCFNLDPLFYQLMVVDVQCSGLLEERFQVNASLRFIARMAIQTALGDQFNGRLPLRF